jgi:hypothetical protein
MDMRCLRWAASSDLSRTRFVSAVQRARLTRRLRPRGCRVTLIAFYCPTHGLLVKTTPHATVRCGETVTKGQRKRRCNKRATTVKPEKKAAC